MQGSSDPRGKTLYDRGGAKVGTIDNVYQDPADGNLTWALVSTGVLGMAGKTLVPLHDPRETADGVAVPYDSGQIRSAPRVADERRLDTSDHQALSQHYGLGNGAAAPPARPDETDTATNDDPGDAQTPEPAANLSTPTEQPATSDAPDATRITPGDLADFGGQLAGYGQQLAEYGQRLARYAQALAERERAADTDSDGER